MCVLERPKLENYASYQHFALAALGYAVVVGGGSQGVGFDGVGIASCVSCVGARLLTDGLDTTLGGSGTADTRPRGRSSAIPCKLGSFDACGVGNVDSFINDNPCIHNTGLACPASCCVERISESGVRPVVDVKLSACSEPVASIADGKFSEVSNSANEDLSSVRGVHWDRNQRWKLRRKERKLKKQDMQANWRTRAKVSPVDSSAIVGKESSKSFFSLCDDDTKRQLRESRAKALVAKNELDAFKATRHLADARAVSDEILLVQQMLKVTKLANQLRKSTRDDKIGGWAVTVADSITKSVADKAPSSIPSLESVGFGNSALRSSDGDSDRSSRLLEYNIKLKELTRSCDDGGFLVQANRDAAIYELKHEYKDVSMTVEERVRHDLNLEISEKLVMAGVSPRVIDDVLGNEYYYY